MEKANVALSNNRIRTIDVLRALTMFLMIFVNDLWSLTGVPEWLGHTRPKFFNLYNTLSYCRQARLL